MIWTPSLIPTFSKLMELMQFVVPRPLSSHSKPYTQFPRGRFVRGLPLGNFEERVARYTAALPGYVTTHVVFLGSRPQSTLIGQFRASQVNRTLLCTCKVRGALQRSEVLSNGHSQFKTGTGNGRPLDMMTYSSKHNRTLAG
jgi:hypothetical protein